MLRTGLAGGSWQLRGAARYQEGMPLLQGGWEITGGAGRWRWLGGNLSLSCGNGALCQTGFGRVPLGRERTRVRLSTSAFSLPGSAGWLATAHTQLLLALVRQPPGRTRGFGGWNLLASGEYRWRTAQLRLSIVRALTSPEQTAVGGSWRWRGWLVEVYGGDLQSWLVSRSRQGKRYRLVSALYGLRRAPPGKWPLATGSGEHFTGFAQEVALSPLGWRLSSRLHLWRALDEVAPLPTWRSRFEWRIEKRLHRCELKLWRRIELAEALPAGEKLSCQARVRASAGWLSAGCRLYGQGRYLWQLRFDRGGWSLQGRTAIGSAAPVAGSRLGLSGTVQWAWLSAGALELRLRREWRWHRYRCDLLLGYCLGPTDTDYPQLERAVRPRFSWEVQVRR